MKQNKTKKKIVSILVVFSMIITMYGFLPMPNAAHAVSITDASDTLSDSDLSALATHTVTFTPTVAVANTGYIDIVLPTDFGDITANGNVVCDAGPGNWTGTKQDAETARCTAGALNAVTSYTFQITDVTNPIASGTQVIIINHYSPTDVLLETVQVTVAIVDDVTMTAHVDATLVFEVNGMTNADTVNGESCTKDTTATTTDFGTLAPDVPQVVCQKLSVQTNATEGYIVTVQQSAELTSDGGATINSFRDAGDGHGTTTPEVWASPTGTLDAYNEYGHMGLTSNDADLSTTGTYEDYQGTKFAGLDGTTPTVVMHHDGPADGLTQNKGLAEVAYKAEVTALQEAGDYTTTLTYIATPTY